MRSEGVAVCLVALWLAAGCRPSTISGDKARTPGQTTPARAHPEVVLPDGAVVTVELATDDQTRQQGLMYRESLDPLKGMLFIFPATGEYPFWMKNTTIPLDILWIDEGSRIVHVKRDVPPCPGDPCPSYPPGVMARYVLELRAGEAARHRLNAGDAVVMRNLDSAVVR